MRTILSIVVCCFISLDLYGQPVERIPAPVGPNAIELISEGTSMFYACAFDVIYRSPAPGAAWIRCTEIPNSVKIVPLYAANDSLTIVVDIVPAPGIHEKWIMISSDNGTSWSNLKQIPSSFTTCGYARNVAIFTDTCTDASKKLTFTLVNLVSNQQTQLIATTFCDDYRFSSAHVADTLYISADGVTVFAISSLTDPFENWTLQVVPDALSAYQTSTHDVGVLYEEKFVLQSTTETQEYALPFKVGQIGIPTDMLAVNEVIFLPYSGRVLYFNKQGAFGNLINPVNTPVTRLYQSVSTNEMVCFLQGPTVATVSHNTQTIAPWNQGLLGPGTRHIALIADTIVTVPDWVALQRSATIWNANAKPLSTLKFAMNERVNSIKSMKGAVWLLGDGAFTLNTQTGELTSEIESVRSVLTGDEDNETIYLRRVTDVQRRPQGVSIWEEIPIAGDYFDMIVLRDSIHMLSFFYGPAPEQVQIINTVFDTQGNALAELRVVTSNVGDGRYYGTVKTKQGMLVNLGNSLRKSTDGGLNWLDVPSVYTFYGAMTTSDSVVCSWCSVGDIQGVCISADGGDRWVMQTVDVPYLSQTFTTLASADYFTFSSILGTFRVPRVVTSVSGDGYNVQDGQAEFGGVISVSVTDVLGRVIRQCTECVNGNSLLQGLPNGQYRVVRNFKYKTISTGVIYVD